MHYRRLVFISCSVLAISTPIQADDFTIDTAANSTNGGNTLDGSDTITVTTNGSIAITSLADGINTSGGNNTATVNGTITTTGGTNRSGVEHNGDNNETIVTGSITTSDRRGFGINNLGDYNTSTVSGQITTGGRAADGIVNAGDYNTTNVSGTIIANGLSADGIYNSGDNNETTLSGTITITGSGGYGIADVGDNNATTITGRIDAGTDDYGIITSGSNNTTNISGTVQSAIGAIRSYGANSYTLQEGAIIIGPIENFLDTATLNIDVGADASYIYTTVGDWTVKDLDGRAFTYSGNVASSLSPGNSETADDMLFERNRSLHASLGRQASSNKSGWADVYSGTLERAANAAQPTMLPYTANANGLSIGVPVLSGAGLLDVVINSHRMALNISEDSQKLDSQSTKIGLVIKQAIPINGWQLAASGFIGRTSYEVTRGKVLDNLSATGVTSLSSEYSSTEAVLAVSAEYAASISKTLRFEGSVEGSYARENVAAYSEGSHFSWDARELGQASGGITAGVVYNSQENLSYHLRVGTQRRTVVQGAQTSYTANGVSDTSDSGLTSETYYSAELGFKYLGRDGMNITGGLGGLSSDLKVSGMTAHLQLNWEF